MDANTILNGMKPLDLLIGDAVQGDRQVYFQRLEQMKTHHDYARLDTLGEDVAHLNGADPGYAVLLLHLADAYRENGRLRTAERFCNRALSRLGCQVDAGCVQNMAVATLYRAILVHLMGRVSESLQHYQHATSLFQEATANWDDLQGHGHLADRCRHAADKLDYYTEELVKDRAPAPQPQAKSTWRPRAVHPVSLFSQPDSPPASPGTWIGLLYLGVVLVAWISFLSIVALLFGGPIAFLVFASAVLTSMTVVAIFARSDASRRLLLHVPMEHVAIVEHGGVPVLVGPGQRRLLVPWYHKLRAVVPLELECTISKQKASLGQESSSKKNQYIVVTAMIRYRIVDPVAAVYSFENLASSQHLPASEKELKKVWDAQLGTDLIPVLVDQVWGATVSDCYDHRDEIQTNLTNEMRSVAGRWGAAVRSLSIVDMVPY